MANIASAKKRIRQDIKRAERNASRLSVVKTYVKKLETAITSANKEDAQKAFNKAQSVISKTAKVGTIHKKTASRKIARLNAKLKKIS
jgi:small subunit ribosomal protein S20